MLKLGKINVKKLDRRTTLVAQIDIRISRELYIRAAIARGLIRLAGWVLSCGVRFGKVNKDELCEDQEVSK